MKSSNALIIVAFGLHPVVLGPEQNMAGGRRTIDKCIVEKSKIHRLIER